ncbi:MAG: glycosyltransferase family 2 protein [Anaerolineaceae bacterium]|nr:glycosyltransferase family 2 protein [Anaerolineaceae bacterium]
MSKNHIWIVLAAYNEAQTISNVLNDLIQYPYQIIVVDDGSEDNTSELALAFPVTVLRHICNLGQGAALQTGISYALLQSDTQAIATFDADGQHNPEEIVHLLEPVLSGAVDVALGTRFAHSDNAINMPFTRRMMLKAAIWYTRRSTRLTLTDTHNGFRAFSAAGAKKIQISSNRMAHASEILNQISKHKLRYQEIPVTIRYTDYSLSKGQSVFEFINILWEIISGGIR